MTMLDMITREMRTKDMCARGIRMKGMIMGHLR
jgi:hypothetical protein